MSDPTPLESELLTSVTADGVLDLTARLSTKERPCLSEACPHQGLIVPGRYAVRVFHETSVRPDTYHLSCFHWEYVT